MTEIARCNGRIDHYFKHDILEHLKLRELQVQLSRTMNGKLQTTGLPFTISTEVFLASLICYILPKVKMVVTFAIWPANRSCILFLSFLFVCISGVVCFNLSLGKKLI